MIGAATIVAARMSWLCISPRTLYLRIGAGAARLASTLVGVNVESDFLDMLNAINHEWRMMYNQTAASFYLELQLATSWSIAFNTSKKSHSTWVKEASTAFSMDSVPDPFYSRFNIKEKSGLPMLDYIV